MTQLRFEDYYMDAASLGEDSCLPDIMNNKYIHTPIRVTDKVTEEERRLIGKGMISTLLPYCIQDGYGRKRKKTAFPAAVLENAYLKATFLPSLGGRLWSLFDKKQGKELLYCNDVFQPANLSLRNAWFSGGVEWNVGIKGHNPLTCSKMFACECKNRYGDPVLKMYEYERIRGVVYSVCATLKDDVLLVHPIIENTENKDKYMYWWSNIAVDEQEGLRVLSPAKESFVSYYDETGYVLDSNPLPVMHIKGMDQAVDVSYPEKIYRSGDFFYKIPKDRKKWVAAVDKDGSGLVQFSDPLLQGRKLFVWGRQQGGRHWNEWLSDGYKPYVEIQAGLLKTQLEHFVMEKCSTIEWTEGYCGVCGDGRILHNSDYFAAADHLEQMIADKFVCFDENRFDLTEQQKPVLFGSGWGALENRIRNIPISHINAFPEESISAEQEDWMQLLQTGALPAHEADQPIAGYVSGEYWKNLLVQKKQPHWYDYYQLGVIYCADCQFNEAMECFVRANQLKENAWSYRCIAQIQKNVLMDTKSAAENMLRAIRLVPNYRPLLWDCADALIADERYSDFLDIYENLREELKENGRIRFFVCVCLIKLERLDEAKLYLNENLVVDDLKEGEYSVSQLWIALYRLVIARDEAVSPEEIPDATVLEKYPLPYQLDFRMH